MRLFLRRARGILGTLPLVFTLAITMPDVASGQAMSRPDTVVVRSGELQLRGLLWRPIGRGPFPAVFFNHGSGGARGSETGRFHQQIFDQQANVLGPVFARHGYVFLYLFRRGTGLSEGRGTFSGDLMERARATQGQDGRNQMQLQLLQNEELRDAQSGLGFLRALAQVDTNRIAVAGHSFGGSLTLLAAERDSALSAVVVFAGAAGSWEASPALQKRLLVAVARTKAPVFFVNAANDYSIAPGNVLAAEMARVGKEHRLKIYPAYGDSAADGHRFVHLNPAAWEADVFQFLGAQMRR